MPDHAQLAIRDAGPMGKAMSIAGMIIGGLVALLFTLDMVTEFPFGRSAGGMVDVGFAICGAILAYLGWNAFREAP
jgi:hypothetical protein